MCELVASRRISVFSVLLSEQMWELASTKKSSLPGAECVCACVCVGPGQTTGLASPTTPVGPTVFLDIILINKAKRVTLGKTPEADTHTHDTHVCGHTCLPTAGGRVESP